MSRYSRQISFPPLCHEGQRRLGLGRVLVIGCGALGGTVADLLVRSGVGRDGGVVTILDSDVVQLSNLHRQTLFSENDCGQLKVEVAKKALLAADSQAQVEVFAARFDENNAEMAENFDLLIDATDNFPSRFLMNRTAVKFRKPLITAGVAGALGQILTILPGKTACLECFLEPQSESAPPVSVLPPLPQFFAALEVIEAIKVLTGHVESVNRLLTTFDLWNNSFREFELTRNPHCPVCSPGLQWSSSDE